MPGRDCLQKYPTFPADPADLSPTNYVALKVWAEAVEISGSFDAEAVAQVLRRHTFDTFLGTLGFDEKGDVTGIEMWSWYRWENGTVVEKAPSELPPSQYGGCFSFRCSHIRRRSLGVVVENPPRNRLVAVRRASLPRA